MFIIMKPLCETTLLCSGHLPQNFGTFGAEVVLFFVEDLTEKIHALNYWFVFIEVLFNTGDNLFNLCFVV